MAVALALAVAGCFALYRGFELDDAWLNLALARGLIDRGTLALPGLPAVHAVDSPAWFAGAWLAEQGSRLTGLDPMLLLRLLSAFFAWTTLVLAALWGRRLQGALAALPPLLLVLDPWFLRAATSGTETPMAAALGVLTLSLWAAERPRLRGAGLLLAVLGGPLVRPELGVLALVLLLDALRRRELGRVTSWRGALVAALAALPVLGWLGFAWANFGTVVPPSWLALAPDGAAAGAALALVLAGTPAAWLALGLVVPGLGLGKRASTVDRVAGPALLWLVLVVAGAGLYGRPPTTLTLVAPLAAVPLAVSALLDHAVASGRSRRLDRTLLGLVTIAATSCVVVTAARALPASSGALARADRAAAAWLNEHAYSRDLVATDRPGLLAYSTNQPLLDLSGRLLPADLRPHQTDAAALLRRARPTFSPVGGAAGARQTELARWSGPSDSPGPARDAERVLLRLEWPPSGALDTAFGDDTIPARIGGDP